MLGSSKPGIAGRLKRRRLSRAAKRRRPPGRRCRVDERPAFAKVGSDPHRFAGVRSGGTHLRSSRERTTLRGAMREPWALAAAQRAFAHVERPGCTQKAREDSASRSTARTTKRCAEPVREGDSPAEKRGEPLLGSARSRGLLASFASTTARLVSPCCPPRSREEVNTKAKVFGGKSPPIAARGIDAARGGARASSYCRSRQHALGLREARDR